MPLTVTTAAQSFSFVGAPRPRLVRVVNSVGRPLERASQRFTPSLSVEALLRAAERKVGFADPEDQTLREPLERLLSSIEADAQLNTAGRWTVRAEIIQLLCRRLRVRDHLYQHPEVLNVPVEQPVFIIGFPRTASTLLHHLMALDPGNRVPKLWELLDPIPPRRATRGRDPRVRKAKRYLRWLRYVSPLTLKIHPMDAEDPEECRVLLGSSFVGPQHLHYNVPGYFEWFKGLPDDRLEAVCQELRSQIQILKQGDGGLRWVGKNPGHSAWGRGLVRAFPDACVVVLHRDPAESIPSLCSLGAAFRSIYTDQVDLHALGRQVLSEFVHSMERLTEMRTAPAPASFYDVHYSNLVADPIGVVRGIYAHAGMPFSHELETRIEQYLARNRQHKPGSHRYSAEQFGLSREEIWRTAEPYLRSLQQLDL